jgi:hypothetical protein
MTDSKAPRIKLSKAEGKNVLNKWKVEVTDKANKKGMPHGYLLAKSVSDHIFSEVAKPIQGEYQKYVENNRKAYRKQVQAWNACEALASDAIKDHLDEYLSGIFATSRQSLTVHNSYDHMMKELSLDDGVNV